MRISQRRKLIEQTRRNKWLRAHRRYSRPPKPKEENGNAKQQKNNLRQQIHAPVILDLFGNTEETMTFFAEVYSSIRNSSIDGEIFFDLSNVEKISSDALMYIIALINNVKRARVLRIHIRGNEPIAQEAKEFIKNMGFYDYVQSRNRAFNKKQNSKFQIKRGVKYDEGLATELCEFASNAKQTSLRISTKRLYPTIMELMTNTQQHAYSDVSQMDCNWYISAETVANSETSVRFVFLDTGEGIPETVRKKATEKVKQLLSMFPFVKSPDAQIMQSVFNGEFRTETGKEYRGKGLPGIYEDMRAGNIRNFKIISGYALGIANAQGTITTQVLTSSFQGSLFCWEY